MSLAWFDGTVDLSFELALSSATSVYGTWDSDTWDSALWGPGAELTDLSSRLRPPLVVDRAFAHETNSWSEGSANVTLRNTDGHLSPANLSGPYVTAGVTGLRPGREARIRATYSGVTYPLYHGYTEDLVEDWDLEDDPAAVVRIPMLDVWDRLSRYDGDEQSPVGAGESSGARIHRILDAAGHAGGRNVDVGLVTVLATTLEGNTAAELNLTADSEGGAVYVGPDGEIVFDQRTALVENTRSTVVQATFGDGSGGVDEIPCFDMGVTSSASLVRNIVSYARVGGTKQEYSDLTSQALYDPRREPRTDLVCELDSQVQALAQWDLSRLRAPEYRVTHVTIKPMVNPARMFPVALGLRLRDLVQCVRRGPGGTLTQGCFVNGIHHEVLKDEWITTVDLISATPYTAFVDSRWDTGTWDGVVWSF